MTTSPESDPRIGHWVSCWAAASQGPYPIGTPIGQPDLSTALTAPALGAVDQSMRMVIQPALWSDRIRIRVCNVFGDRDIHLSNVGVGLHLGGGALVPGTWSSLKTTTPFTVPNGQTRWSPAIELPWVRRMPPALMQGRSLAVSWHVEGVSGPLSWHAKSMGTSYLSRPGQSSVATEVSEKHFPHTTTSCFLLDAVDGWLPDHCQAIVAFGDSLTDGTCTTLNGHDRWADVLQRALWASGVHHLGVVNAGIGGNQVAGPLKQAGASPFRGGLAAVDRLENDVLSLSGVSTVIWLQGINDFSDNGNLEADTVLLAMQEAVARLQRANIRVLLCTVPSAFGSTRQGHGGDLQELRRRAFNTALRQRQFGDGMVDLDQAMTDHGTGRLRSEFNGDSTFGEPGDGVHPNRAGHVAMAMAILTSHGKFLSAQPME